MAERSDIRRSFRESLQQFILTDVTPLGNVLGTGSYGSVEEVRHNHVICAGKRLYDTLIEDGNQGAGFMVQKYLQECQLMSSLRHPNITLFLGVCFLPDSKLPLLVMERLDTNLDDILEHMPNLPLSLKCSVLEDIARGLLYLHGRSSPIIHRDLTARNILLTASLDAKITDMGNSRIIDLKPGQLVRTLSQIPGTLVYMPPEALDDKHRYGPSLDIFSFGHLALFTIIQKFPGVLLSSTYLNPDNVEDVKGRSEVERRMEYFNSLEAEIGQAHPTLILLIKQCLHNAPHKRPETEELLTRLQGIRVGVEGLHQSSRIAKLEVMRARLENQVARKPNSPERQNPPLKQKPVLSETPKPSEQLNSAVQSRQGPPKSPRLQVPKSPRLPKPPAPSKPAGLSKSSAMPKPQKEEEQPAPESPQSVPPIPRPRLQSLKNRFDQPSTAALYARTDKHSGPGEVRKELPELPELPPGSVSPAPIPKIQSQDQAATHPRAAKGGSWKEADLPSGSVSPAPIPKIQSPDQIATRARATKGSAPSKPGKEPDLRSVSPAPIQGLDQTATRVGAAKDSTPSGVKKELQPESPEPPPGSVSPAPTPKIQSLDQTATHARAAKGAGEQPPVNRVEQDLEEQEWYWGAISKHDVDAKFHGTLDGTFLVYDSHTRGRYILMVRRGKANEVIHISHCNGMYGFLDTSKLPPKPIFTEFRTIPALVEHFRRVPLTKYNERLDITLDHPIRRSAVDFKSTSGIFKPLPHNPSEHVEDTYYNCTKQEDVVEESYENLAQEDVVEESYENLAQEDVVEESYENLAQEDVVEEDLYEDLENLTSQDSEEDGTDSEGEYVDLSPDVPPRPLEEQVWYWGRMTVSEVDKKLSDTPDGTFLVCDSQTEGKHILVVRKDETNEIIYISQVDRMYGFFDMSVLPRKPILTDFLTIPALVEHFEQVPLTKYKESLDVTLAYPVSRESVDSPSAQQDLSPLKDQEWYWGGISSEKIGDELRGTPNGTFLVRDSGKKGNYTLVVRMDGENMLARIYCSGNNKYGFYSNPVDPSALVEFPSVPALVEYFKRVPLTQYIPSLNSTLARPLARVLSISQLDHRGFSGSNDSQEQARYYEIDKKVDHYENIDDEKYHDTELLGPLPELPPRQKIAVDNTNYPLSTPKKMNETVYYDNAVTVISKDYFKTSPDKDKPFLALPTGRKSKKEPLYNRLVSSPQLPTKPKPHAKMDTWFCDIDRNAATAMLTRKPSGTFLCRPTNKSCERLKGAVHSHTMDLVYNKDLVHLRVYHKGNKFGFETDPCRFFSLMDLVMYFSDNPIHHNCDTTLKYPARK